MDEVKSENNTNELTENKPKTFEPEVVSVKQNNGYQPEVVEVIQRKSYQPQAVAPNTNEYLKQDAGIQKEATQTIGNPVQAQTSFVQTQTPPVQTTEEEVRNVSFESKTTIESGTPMHKDVSQPVNPASNQPNGQPVNPASNQPNRQPVNPNAGNRASKKKKEKGGPNFFVRVLLTIVLGVVFGLVAGATFLGVKTIGEKLISSNGNGAGDGTIATSEPVSETASEEPGDVIVNNTGALDSTQVMDKETEMSEDYVVQVAQECMPSVVIINITTQYNYYGMIQEAQGSGSGFIVGENGDEILIATNYHVIADSTSTTVQFCDGSTAPAEVRGKKVSMDLAVIAVDLSALGESTKNTIKVATLGDSDNLKVGESVIAIGNALGYGQSVTVGVVSALNREIETELGEKNTFIQTDAAINPGNSGGALINKRGEVIGINSNKIGGSTVEGMGYAIPISQAKPIIEKLMAKQELTALPEDQQSYFGIMGTTVKSGMVTNDGVSIPSGIYVNQVNPGTPAEKAGIQRNDIITEFEGNSVTDMQELKDYLAAYPAGSKVIITFRRYENYKFETYEVEVTLENKTN
ncbi:MAG: trypsin-like peptidase domain-containing protein [Lachnospiraceae bacterium]|nr:trypsin-like peptidase domain-containing protein [Lachnospiraceae bacterium]